MNNKRYFIAIALFCGCLLTNCGISKINKEFSIRNDLGEPVKGAKVYILWKELPDMLPLWLSFGRHATRADLKTAKIFHLDSNKEGKINLRLELYRPSEYDLIIIKKGYYPTLVPLKTTHDKLVLLSQKRFKSTITGKYKEEVQLLDKKHSLPGITYEKMELQHPSDSGSRLDGMPSPVPKEYNKYNFEAIYNSYKKDDGVFLQEKASVVP